jgi:hemoglobin
LEGRVAVTTPISTDAATRGDLDTRAKIHDVVVDFYREIVFDDVLGPVFGEVAEVDWALHIPKLIDYWCRVLLGERGYDGYFLGAHERVDGIEPFASAWFARWLELWEASIDKEFAGPTAARAKRHAQRMAGVLAKRLMGRDWQPEGACPAAS